MSGSAVDRFDVLARLAVRGENRALELIAESARHVARATVLVAGILDVEMFILAGSAFAVPGAIYASRIREALDDYTRHLALQPVIVELAHNPRDTAAVGASALVLQQALAPRK